MKASMRIFKRAFSSPRRRISRGHAKVTHGKWGRYERSRTPKTSTQNAGWSDTLVPVGVGNIAIFIIVCVRFTRNGSVELHQRSIRVIKVLLNKVIAGSLMHDQLLRGPRLLKRILFGNQVMYRSETWPDRILGIRCDTGVYKSDLFSMVCLATCPRQQPHSQLWKRSLCFHRH